MAPVAVITGGGTGIGAATAQALWPGRLRGRRLWAPGRAAGAHRRRADRSGGTARAVVLDVADAASVAAAAAQIGACDVLVNNAGGAMGSRAGRGRQAWPSGGPCTSPTSSGCCRSPRRCCRRCGAAPTGGSIVVVSSIAGLLVYEGGAGYTAAKHGATALVETLRLELAGEPIRVIEIDPGMVVDRRLLAHPLPRRPGQGRRGVCRCRPPARGRRCRRVHRLLRAAAAARQRRPAGRQAGRPGGTDKLHPGADRLDPHGHVAESGVMSDPQQRAACSDVAWGVA
jgi:NADP-dependent 3-hydroxy acid dehydrogenase YdfG